MPDTYVARSVLVSGDGECQRADGVKVLGAAMFHVQVGTQSVVYSGDYNTTPDRHLGPARIDRLKPDLFITETTYESRARA